MLVEFETGDLDSSNIPVILENVRSQAAGCPLEAAALKRVVLALEESLVNIAQYAYGGKPGPFGLKLDAQPGSLRVELVDSGPPFDPLSHPEPDTKTSIESGLVGGFGVHLMRNLSDGLEYRREGGCNHLVLTFKNRGEK